jgi:mRNA-degrading endonuclease toxin of MazEF toxin-antitoxin module
VEKYQKDFDRWNVVKKNINAKNRRVFFYEKEIWWMNVGINVGSEQDGKGNLFIRPVFIYKKINSRTFLGIPLTKVLKEDLEHVPFYFDYDISTVIISQIRVFDRKRLEHRMGSVSDYLFLKIKKAVIAFVS